MSIDKVFIGLVPTPVLKILRAAAEIAKGRKVAPGVQALVVPGSGPVKASAEAEGLDKIHRSRLRVAPAGLLHVSGDEQRPQSGRERQLHPATHP